MLDKLDYDYLIVVFNNNNNIIIIIIYDWEF